MQQFKYFALLIIAIFLFNLQSAFACHPLPLINFNQQNYIPGTGMQITATSDPNTWGCDEYWLDMEIRCDSNVMDGSGVFAGIYDTTICFPYLQSPQMLKPTSAAQTYPWITIPDSVLCPGMTYQYRLRENHNNQVGPWTPIMNFTMPGTLDTNVGHLILTANPSTFCGFTQLGWNWIPGGGCTTSGCGAPDTSYQWYVISGEPINVPVNFSCDTCPYPTASPSIQTTYGLTITVGDSNACGYGVYTMTPITVTPLPLPFPGTINYTADCNGNVELDITGYFGDLQWQSSSGGGPWTNIAGATLDTLSESGVSAGDCYTVEISTVCGTTFSDTVCMGAITPTVPGTVNYTADCNGNVSFNITGHQGNVQWESSVGGGAWTAISSATMDTTSQSGVNTGDCFRVFITSDCDSTYSDTVCIIIPENPVNGVISYNADCSGNVDLWVDSAQGNLQWQSSIAGGPWTDISGATMDSLSQSGINTGDCFRVMIFTVCDTLLTDTVCPTMFIGPTAGFSFSPPGNSQSNVPVSFTDESIGDIVTWEWDFGDNSPPNNTHIPNPTHTYHNTGVYYVTLIVTDANGCTDTLTLPYGVDTLPGNQKVIIPNVMTPNGDGDNDFLVFKNLEHFGNKLKVFNRWGKLIYEKINYKNNWDGDGASEGTYYFILEVDITPDDSYNKSLYKGNLNILR